MRQELLRLLSLQVGRRHKVPENSETKHEPMIIGLLGASFDTGNMGVSALAESSIKVILDRWPDAEITLLGSGYVPRDHRLSLSGKEICVKTVPIRFSRNIFLPYHFLLFTFYGLLVRVLPISRLKNALVSRNPYFKILYEADLVADITGGDSFSDIYGMRRFVLGFLRKWLVLVFNKDLIMLPQTYGPFERPLAKAMARYILRRASAIYSRDRDSLDYVKSLLNSNTESGKVRFAPDVAFVLDPCKPKNFDTTLIAKLHKRSAIVVGLNVSGLLFNGGYTRENMFGLKTDYRELIYDIIEMLLKDKKVVVLLVPHVFPPPRYEVESDLDACRQVYDLTAVRYKNRIFLVNGGYNHNEIKYIIGLCDFFIGSRMHSCIAAISQNIPTIGIAYSKKFQGVFESVGLGNCVVDACNCDKKQLLEKVESVLEQKGRIRRHLEHIVPRLKEDILGIFNDSNGDWRGSIG